MINKEAVYRFCLDRINEKIALLQDELASLRDSIGNETKSSAGDKHETARAHLQISQEQAGRQLAAALEQRNSLEQTDRTQSATFVKNGSLIRTSTGYLFIGIALGRLTIGADTVIALSARSPLGMQLMGLEAGASASLNGVAYLILELF